jgi:hypothetical protein
VSLNNLIIKTVFVFAQEIDKESRNLLAVDIVVGFVRFIIGLATTIIIIIIIFFFIIITTTTITIIKSMSRSLVISSSPRINVRTIRGSQLIHDMI